MARMLSLDTARETVLPRVAWRDKLEGVFYRFDMRWNNRDQFWTLSLYADSGEALFQGRRLTENHDLLRIHKGKAYPPGKLVAKDLEGQNREPGRYAFRDTHALIYVESE